MNPEPALPSKPASGLLRGYRPPEGGWDEMVAPDGGIRPAWAGLASALEELGSGDVRRRKQALAEQLRSNGVTYNVYGDSQGADRPWSLDPVPMVLESLEWEGIERGLIQRATLLDAILRDIYGPRRLMREGLIPALFLFSHQGFQRACSGNPAVQQRMLRFYSADLARGADGAFRVISDRGQNPSGYGYALENRSVLGRALPSLFREAGVRRLDGFFQSFRKSLAEAAPADVREPYAVLLSAGPENETFFEQAYLASYLGIPLVRGGDLTARDGGIHLLSLNGTRKVDVILRRVDDAFCDPLELNGSSLLGVPGLLQAVRNRKVAVCNALGSGILTGSGIMPFLPAISRRLLGQELILPSAATWWCGDRAQREAALDRFGEMVIKPLYQGPKRSIWFVNRLTREQREKLIIRIRAKPQLYLAQETLLPSTAPCFVSDRLEARSLVLRSFLAASGESFSVMPGGLARVSSKPDSFEVSGQEGGISKDTWILASDPMSWAASREPAIVAAARETASRADQQARTGGVPANRQPGPLPGYAAENLFWLGRYQERLACQVRAWREILARAGEWRLPFADGAPEWMRLLWSYEPAFPDFTGDPAVLETLIAGSLEDDSGTGSPAFNHAAMRRTARAVRDLLPDDCWLAVNSLLQPFDGESPQRRLERSVLHLAGLEGLQSESLALGPVRRFLLMGRALERALCTVRSLAAALGGNLSPSESLLESLLACNDGLHTYRQRYQRGILAGPAADLLIADELNPRSVACQLARFAEELALLPFADSAPLTACRKTVLLALTSARVFDAEGQGILRAGSNEAFEHLLGSLEGRLGQASDLLSREFFQPIPLPQSLREWT
ncbi:MAG: hypothetical protein JWP91_2920 [Fibrobacteres bacterium]|nr:hypothetical protein [Fibrobacterota bacterium]